MSASDRLRALDEALTEAIKNDERIGEMLTSTAIAALPLNRALPQIVAVVEAAERETEYDCINGIGHYELTERGGGDLGRALAALDEKLNGAEASPTPERGHS